MGDIVLRGIRKAFGGNQVLEGVDLCLTSGSIVALLGRSGSGKSTLGRVIVGLEAADGGSVALESQRVMLLPQDFVVWPHLSVEKNVALGYQGPKELRGSRVQHLLQLLHLGELASRRGGELSYGQQQRVALARCFCFSPSLLVLDEPLAHLDVPLRKQVATELAAVCRTEGVTTLWITHDAHEAYAVADQIAVLDGGVIVQADTPENSYLRPASLGAAALTGDVNVLNREEWQSFCAMFSISERTLGATYAQVAFRPEALRIDADGTEKNGVRFVRRRFVAPGYHYIFNLETGREVRVSHSADLPLDSPYKLTFCAEPWFF